MNISIYEYQPPTISITVSETMECAPLVGLDGWLDQILNPKITYSINDEL
jgi:hypothetical protein